MTSGVSRYLCQSLIEPIGNGLVGSDLRTWHRFWTDYGLLGHNRIVEVLPTNPELVLATTSDAKV